MFSVFWRGYSPVKLAFARFTCLLNRHVPFRKRANWDGSGYVARCRDCGRPIKRIAHRKWRKRREDAPSTA
jgi:hypothetical protein